VVWQGGGRQQWWRVVTTRSRSSVHTACMLHLCRHRARCGSSRGAPGTVPGAVTSAVVACVHVRWGSSMAVLPLLAYRLFEGALPYT
jgi:hypothetical protein